MRYLALLSFILLFSSSLFSQNNVDYKNHYKITILDIENEELAKPAIGHLRKISNSKRCDFNNDNDTFSIQTNTKVSLPYLTNELNKFGYSLLTYLIIKED